MKEEIRCLFKMGHPCQHFGFMRSGVKLAISTSHHHQWRLESTHLTFSLTLLQKTRSVPLSKTPTILTSRLFDFLGSQLNATHVLIPESLSSGGMT